MFPLLLYIIYLSLQIAPDRVQYLYYLGNPDAATRIEPGFVIVLYAFDAIGIPPDVSLTLLILFIISLYMHTAFSQTEAHSTTIMFAMMVFVLTVFITPTLIQVRFGIAIGLAVLGYSKMRSSFFWGASILIMSGFFHIAVIYFVICTFLAYLFLWMFKGTKTRLLILFCFLIGPTFVFQVFFAVTSVSEYYRLYFADNYNNVVFSLSTVTYSTLVLFYIFMNPRIDHTMVIAFSGLGVLLLVITSGFAVFHRLYFPAMFLVFCHVLDSFLRTDTSKLRHTIVLSSSVLFLPIAIYFACLRLDLL